MRSQPEKSQSAMLPNVCRAVGQMSALFFGIAIGEMAYAAEAERQKEASATAVLPMLVVESSSEAEVADGHVNGYVAKRTATATRTDTAIAEIPQSISVITADQIEDLRASSLQEVLRYTPGVRAEAYGLNSRSDSFRLRGGSEGSTLLNGMRSSQAHPFDTYLTDEPFAFERIEVLRGPSSVMAGQNGPGGVVNLISKRPQVEVSRRAEVQFGNYDHKQASVDLTGPINEDKTILYRLVALNKSAMYQVNHARNNREYVAPSVTWKIRTGTSLTLLSDYQRDRSGTTIAYAPYSGTLYPSANGQISPSLFTSEPSWDSNGGERLRLSYLLEHDLNSDWKIKHGLRRVNSSGGYKTLYPAFWESFIDSNGNPDPNGTARNREIFAFRNKSQMTNAVVNISGSVKTGQINHKILAGLDFMRVSANYRTLDGTATPLDLYQPVYGTFPEPSFDGLPIQKANIRNTGFVLQDQAKIYDRYIVVGGLRYDRANTLRVDESSKNKAISKNLGFVYLGDRGVSPYVSYTESFEPEIGADRFNNAFKPKRGKQYEMGVRWTPRDRVLATAAIYELTEKNRRSTDPLDPNYDVQLGEVTAKGFELGVTAQVMSWDLIANYTYTKASVTSTSILDEDSRNKQLRGIPKHSAALWAVHHFGHLGLPNLKAGAGVRYVGKTGDGLDTIFAPSYTLLDMLVAHESRNWRLALNVSNLTNRKYLGACNFGYCNYGPLRQAVVSASIKW